MTAILFHLKNVIKSIYSTFHHFDIKVYDKNQTLKYILQNNSSVIRFGDGEFDIIHGENIIYQQYNQELAKRLTNLILNGSSKELIVCLPDVFHELNRYNTNAKKFYKQNFFWKNRIFLEEIQTHNNCYGSTFISRPYIDLKNKRGTDIYFKALKELWNNKNILIVEGKYSRSGEGNDLFKNAKTIQRIICPPHDAFSKLKIIEQSIKDNCKNKTVLLMLGPTAKIVIDDLKYLNIQMIDLGHIDSEYEWFKMGVTTKVQIPNKHTAEVQSNQEILINTDHNFDKQVIKIIE